MNKHRAIALLVILASSLLAACVTQPDEKLIAPVNTEFDPKNSYFLLGNEPVQLVNGVAVTPIDNSAAQISTHYAGQLVTGDLNGDGQPDQAFWIRQTTGGSGAFYYVVAALRNESGYQTTNAHFVGERIEPQHLLIPANSRQLQVYFATHKANEAMSERPTAEKVLLLKVTAAGVLEGYMK